jgi:hypothetical protein
MKRGWNVEEDGSWKKERGWRLQVEVEEERRREG